MDNWTLKKEIISNFSCLPTSSDEFDDSSIILITPAGVITGSLADADHDLVRYSDEITDIYHKEQKIKRKGTDPLNDSFICLENVTLKTSNEVFSFNFLNIFYDQIIGVTIGTLK